jgi:hypothetical protein
MIPIAVSHQSFLVDGKQPLIYIHQRTGWAQICCGFGIKEKNPNFLDEINK